MTIVVFGVHPIFFWKIYVKGFLFVMVIINIVIILDPKNRRSFFLLWFKNAVWKGI